MTTTTDGVGIGGKVGGGVAWSAINSFVLRAGQFAMGVVVARIVSPHDFGVFIVALTVFAIVVNVSEVGVSSALIREPERSAELAPSVTTIALVTSAVLALLMVVSAPWAAAALGSSAATSSIRVLSLTVLLAGAGAVPSALLTRDFKQKQRFVADLSFFVASNGVLLILALLGAGALALAWSRVAGQLVSTGFLIYLAPERYWPQLNRDKARGLLRYGLPLAGANLVGFAIANLDFMVVGRLKGALKLGYYNLAFNISNWPVSVFSAVLNGVTLPTLSRVRGSRDEIEMHLAAGLSALAAAAFPVSALSIALADPLIETVYGPRWKPAAVALVVLSVYGSTRVVIALLSDLLVAIGRTRSLFGLQLLWLAALAPTMIVGVHRWGIAGAGIAHSVVVVAVVIPAYLYVIHVKHGIRLGWFYRSASMPLLAAGVGGIVAKLVADRVATPWMACICGALAGMLAYLAVLWPWLTKLVKHLRGLYGKRGGVASDTAATDELEPIIPIVGPRDGMSAPRSPL